MGLKQKADARVKVWEDVRVEVMVSAGRKPRMAVRATVRGNAIANVWVEVNVSARVDVRAKVNVRVRVKVSVGVRVGVGVRAKARVE